MAHAPTLPHAGRTPRVAPWFVVDLRKLAAAVSAGLLVGFVVNGIGSRLAMMLLAVLNPQATGMRSDDGFTMGQFGLGDTLGLILFTTALGVLGGLVFLAVRGLRVGPGWFRTASIVVGPAVVIGAALVHTGGVDFTVLEPAWLAIALFVALPGLFAYAVSRVADSWLADDSWFLTSRRGWLIGLAPAVLLGPAVLFVVAALALRAIHHGVPAVRALLTPRRIAIPARLGLTGIFGLALWDLVRDAIVLL